MRKLKHKLWNSKRHCLSIKLIVTSYIAFKDTSNRLRSLTRNLRCQHDGGNQVSKIANDPNIFWCDVNASLKTRPDMLM